MKRTLAIATVVLALAASAVAACAPPFGEPVAKTLYVGPYQVDCTGVAPKKCLLVREKAEQEWTLFYESIQGFAYEEGFDYELRVSQEKVDNPPADASTYRWTLVEEVSKTRTLEGTTWLLSSYLHAQGQMVQALPGSQVTARFQAGQVGGNAGCNSYFGTYEVDGGKITVRNVGSTMMYCAPEALMAQEQDYLAALGQAGFHVITGDELRIADANGQTLLKYGVLRPQPLVGTNWELAGYNNGKEAVVSVLAGTEVTASFGADGTLSGSAGCNHYSGQFQAEGSTLSIGPLAATRKMCAEPPGSMEQETAYMAALGLAASFRLEGDELEVFDVASARLATYVAASPGLEAAEATTSPAPTLTGVDWKWEKFLESNDDVLEVNDPNRYTVEFLSDGQLHIQADCNEVKGSYTVDGSQLALEIGPSTRMACPPDTLDTEYLRLLDDVVSFVFEEGKLALAVRYDTGIMIFSTGE